MIEQKEINTNARIQNQRYMYQSDIFHQKDSVIKSEYIQKHKENDLNRNKTSYNFLSFNPKNIQEQHKIKECFTKSNIVLGGGEENKQPINHRNYDDTYTRHKKGFNTDHINLGNYDGNEYKVVKKKNNDYNPDKYYQKNGTALDRKMKQIYGENIIIGQEKKTNINRNRVSSKIKDEFYEHNEYNPIKVSTANSKQMKYFNLYGEKGIEKMENQLKFMKENAKNNHNKYILGEDCLKNKINMLSSNIFNSEPNENLRNNIDTKKSHRKNHAYSSQKIMNNNFGKKFKIKTGDMDYCPSKINWNDPKSNLYFKTESNENIAKQNAHQRKLKEFYGSSTKYERCQTENKNNINDRKNIEKLTSEKNPQIINIAKIKKISENISQIGQKNLNEVFNNKNAQNENITCEVKCNKNASLDLIDIEKTFANKGIHLYDLKEEARPVLGNRNDNKIIFKIRKNDNDANFETKLKEAQNELKNKKGIMINTAEQKTNKLSYSTNIKRNNNKSPLPSQYKIHVNKLSKK